MMIKCPKKPSGAPYPLRISRFWQSRIVFFAAAGGVLAFFSCFSPFVHGFLTAKTPCFRGGEGGGYLGGLWGGEYTMGYSGPIYL